MKTFNNNGLLMTFDTIFNEAIIFFVFFVALAIVSFIISKKNAKKYEDENPLQERKDAARKERLADMYLNSSMIKVKGKDVILSDLSKLLEEKIINEEEFEILKSSLYEY